MNKIFEFTPVFVDDEFDILDIKEYGKLYINSTHFAFLCPCGGYTFKKDNEEVKIDTPIILSYTKDEIPNWELVNNNGLITITPSILIKGHCVSHFFIKNNKIEWCES